MSNIAPIAYDAESEAYLQRYPGLREALAQYGPNGARLHWQNYGQNEGRIWGAPAAVTPTAAPAAPVGTVSTASMPAMYGTDVASWDAYLKAGRTAAEGINQMPGVFSDYDGIPTDDKAANALFYPGSTPATGGGAMTNPLLAGIASIAGAQAAPQSNALLSPSQRFNRILDMGAGAFSTPVHQMVDERGGSISPEDLAFYVEGKDYYGV